ncbi:MAG: acyl-CoA thioesterase [Brevinematia bacterium]
MEDVSRIRVRYAETDQMGVVYYSNYFIWMEIGRTNLLRNKGLSYKKLEEEGYALPVLKAYAEYLKPAHYDEEIFIHSALTEMKGPKIKIEYRIFNENNTLLATGYTEHAFISSKTGRVTRPPEAFIRLAKELIGGSFEKKE